MRVRTGIVLPVTLALLTGAASQVDAQILYTVATGDNLLRTVNPSSGATSSSVAMTMAGQTVDSARGLATDPTTQTLWVLLSLVNVPGRVLATVNASTGVATMVGNTGDSFAGIAFDCSRNLWGVTGDGADVPESLFRLSKTDGSATFVLTLGRGDDGETIGFNPVDGMMYHASGHLGDYNPGTDAGVIFERINLTTLAITDIPIAGTALVEEEAQALAWWPTQNVFLWKQNHGTGPLFRVTTSGSPTLIGDLDHQAKGLAFVPTFQCRTTPGVPVPTVGTAGVVVLMLLLATGAVVVLRRRAPRA